MTMLNRTIEEPVELLTREDGTKVLSGYSMKWYDGTPATEFAFRPGVVERIKKETAELALSQNPTVLCRFNHDPKTLLDTTDQTLKLVIDDKGLRYEAPFDESDPDHKNVEAKLKRGLIKGSSFGSNQYSWKFEKDGDKQIAWLDNFDLIEVGPCFNPAYKGTTACVRDDSFEKALADHEASLQPKVEPVVEETPLVRSEDNPDEVEDSQLIKDIVVELKDEKHSKALLKSKISALIDTHWEENAEAEAEEAAEQRSEPDLQVTLIRSLEDKVTELTRALEAKPTAKYLDVQTLPSPSPVAPKDMNSDQFQSWLSSIVGNK